MGFRQALVPAGSAGLPGSLPPGDPQGGTGGPAEALASVREVTDVRSAIAAALGNG